MGICTCKSLAPVVIGVLAEFPVASGMWGILRHSTTYARDKSFFRNRIKQI